MGTTSRGIYYPDPDSPVENLRGDLQLLAETADDAITGDDTGWVPLEMVNDWTSSTAAYRRIGSIVALRGFVTGPPEAAGLPCAYLPTGLRARATWVSAVTYDGGATGFATVEIGLPGLPYAGGIRCGYLGDLDPDPTFYSLDTTYFLN